MSSPVVIRLQADTLNEEAVKFTQAPLRGPVFLNSIPKSGTHLLRNIVRMFVAPEQTWPREFIQLPNLAANRAAFARETPVLSWGHLLFSALMTGYIAVGIQMEERSLLRKLGDDYRCYRERTPMLIPSFPARRPEAVRHGTRTPAGGGTT